MRILHIISKELKCIRENVSFNLVTILSPLLFLLAFWIMLSGGVTLPVQIYPDTQSSAFLTALEGYRAPDGTPYMELHFAKDAVPPTNAESDLIVMEEELSLSEGVLSGKIVHYINDVNENMTKNFRNRLDGALVNYADTVRNHGNVSVQETTMYEKDIPWNTSFGVSVLAFGLILAGILFGMLSMTGEWENKTTKLLKLSPYRPGIVISGKLAASLLKCLVSGAVYILIFFFISKALPIHAASFVLVLLLGCGMFVCIGMCVGIYIRSTLTAFLISLVTALTLWVGGGGFGSLSYFGDVANVLGNLNPATYALEIIRWSYFSGSADLRVGFSILSLGFVLAFSLITVVYTRWARSEEVGK